MTKQRSNYKISRRTFLKVCAAAAAAGLTACSGEQKAAALPTLTVGSDAYPPFIYLSNDGVPAGIDADIAAEAFARMGYSVRFETIDWEQKTNLVESGAIDCIWGCFSIDGRKQLYRWAGPYMVSRQVVAVSANSSIETLADLAGKTIMVQSTTKPEEILLGGTDPRIPQLGEVLSAENRSVQYAMLNCGYVDAIAAHETAILQYMTDYGADFRILDKPLLITGIGAAFSVDDDRGLAQELMDTFAQMRQDGTMQEIVGRYLEHPETYLEVECLEP